MAYKALKDALTNNQEASRRSLAIAFQITKITEITIAFTSVAKH
jgi:hypothetical protein